MDLIGLIPSFGSALYTVAAFVVALSVIVAIHEYGHYIVGRWSGIKADVFSIGFGPVLFARTDRHGTRWQIAALPFGGYVKFAGDADATSVSQSDTVGADGTAPRHTMHGAPLWARAATVAAGPVFNFILSIAIFSAVLMFRGVATDPLVVDEVQPLPSVAQGVEPGDRLLEIAGRETPELDGLDAFIDELPMQPVLDYTVARDGSDVTVAGAYPEPPLVGGVTPQSAAFEAGIERGDVITRIDGQEVFAFSQLRDVVGNSDGRPLDVTLWRPDADGQGGETLELTLTPKRMDLPLSEGGFETRWLIGITGVLYFSPRTETPGPFQALAYGADQTVFIVRASLSGLYNMAVGAISSCNLRGPIGIAQTSGAAASQGGLSFIWFIAVLSTAVGLLNLFPIPVLDGGHLVFHAYEAVRGKPPGDWALNVLMAIGLALLGTMMVFALFNDIFCP